jgi:hypothetical protein
VNVAQHAVKPMCPRCDHYVRSSVELKGALADLAFEVALVVTTAHERSAGAQQAKLEDLWLRYEAVQAELAGEHLACGIVLH